MLFGFSQKGRVVLFEDNWCLSLSELSLIPRLHPQNGKWSGDIRAVSWLCGISKKHVCQYIFLGKCHVNAESAQPKNCLNVTRHFPILWVGSGDETRVN